MELHKWIPLFIGSQEAITLNVYVLYNIVMKYLQTQISDNHSF